jgi:alkanesulfonate monooxygenase SsuD/methylene tetrahydromethanopterin reductase-like flavin-dependent oxidoreductase (luciferase family)
VNYVTETKFGIHLPSSSDILFADIVSYAKKCEQSGFDSVWVADHLLSSSGYGVYEPLTLLAGLVSSTRRIKVGTSVLIAALRNPILLADITGTIQIMSGGRLTLGVGVGWDEHEFQNLSVSFEKRGSITDELLEIVSKLWTGKKVDHNGQHFSVREGAIAAKSEQKPDVWIGGNSGPAIRRAARWDAWFPTDPTIDEIRKGRGVLSKLVADNGKLIAAHIYLILGQNMSRARKSAKFLEERTGETMKKVEEWAIVGDLKTSKARLLDYMDAGVEYFVFSLPYTSQYLDSINPVSELVHQL